MSATATAAPAKPAYTMPKIGLGQTILHYANQDKTGQQASVGFVTFLGTNNTITAMILPARADRASYEMRFGIRHVSDPKPTTLDREVNGFWDYTDDSRLLNEIRQDLQEVREQVAALMNTVKPRK